MIARQDAEKLRGTRVKLVWDCPAEGCTVHEDVGMLRVLAHNRYGGSVILTVPAPQWGTDGVEQRAYSIHQIVSLEPIN